MERELLELASGMLVVWGRLAIGTCLSITESGSIAADGSCLFFSSVFCFLFFSLGDGEPGYRPSTPKVYTGNRRVRKLVGIGTDAQPPRHPEDGTLPIVFGGLRRAGRIRIGGSLVGGQERKCTGTHKTRWDKSEQEQGDSRNSQNTQRTGHSSYEKTSQDGI